MNRKLVVIVIPIVVLLIIAAVLWGRPVYQRVVKLLGMEPKLMQTQLAEFTVNLQDPGMRRYLRTRLVLEHYSERKLIKEIVSSDPIIRDAIIDVLSSKSVAEISSPEDTDRLRGELIEIINSILTQGEITNIFFVERIIQ
jgi:flagellar FliL protein